MSPFWTPPASGEGLDHTGVMVRSTPEILERLRTPGVALGTRKLWVNERVIGPHRNDREWERRMSRDVWTTETGHRIGYIPDADGLYRAFYDHPEEEWAGPIPDRC